MSTVLDTLAAQHRPMLVCYARTLLGGDEHLAEDVVQECFLTAHRRFEDFLEGADFGSWLRGIARNKVLEKHRQGNSRSVLVDSRVIEGMEDVFAIFDTGSIAEESWRDRLLRMLENCLGKLPPAMSEAMDSVYRKGFTLRQAAQNMKTTPAALAQRVRRARDLIRECVQREQTEDV